MQSLTSAWWMVLPKDKPDGTIEDCQLVFRHGRHRQRGGNGPEFRAGAWCKWVGTHWEPINA